MLTGEGEKKTKSDPATSNPYHPTSSMTSRPLPHAEATTGKRSFCQLPSSKENPFVTSLQGIGRGSTRKVFVIPRRQAQNSRRSALAKPTTSCLGSSLAETVWAPQSNGVQYNSYLCDQGRRPRRPGTPSTALPGNHVGCPVQTAAPKAKRGNFIENDLLKRCIKSSMPIYSANTMPGTRQW